ncbi:MAG: hypothetical protein E7047_05215 [Lentisphaerae bacterium]|nr:hypothetical protein [Lentisphaerota bacterium]
MLKTLIRPAMIFVPLALGMLFPQANALNFLIRWLLMVMLFMVFLRLNVSEMKLRRSHGWLLLGNLLLGIGCYYLAGWLFKDKTLAQAAFFVAITPTATAAAVVMSFLKGNVGYVITSFVTTNVGIALVLPWLLGLVCGNPSWSFMLKVAETLAVLLVLPLALAMIVRKIHPEAQKWPQKLGTATFGLWSVCLFIIAASAAHFLKENPQLSRWVILETALIALVICIVNFTLGYWLGEKSLRREASQSLGQKNTTLTIYLAFAYAGPLAAMGVISYVLWHNSYNALQMFMIDRKARRLTSPDGCEQP